MFTLLLVTANTMSMAVRERRTEIGVLKALGFPERIVLWLILAEGVFLGVCGAALGLLLGGTLVGLLPEAPVIGDLIRAFPRMHVPPSIGALLGLTASLLPAAPACRARIVALLRQA
jgi:putative ABC transport system permease protein